MKNLRLLTVLAFIAILSFASAAGNYGMEITSVSPTSLVPGERSELSFDIENNGNIDIESASFSWEEKTGSILPIGASNTKIIDDFDTRNEETINFDIFTSASAEPGLYEIIISITYQNGNESFTESSKVGVIVGGQTDFDVSVSDFSSGGVVLSVANIGKNPAESVNIIIPTQTNFKVSGSSSSIIGNLDKGDYSVASFEITSQSEGYSSLNVEIQYTDTMGTRQTITKTVQIQSAQSSFLSVSSSDSTGNFVSQDTADSSNWFLIAFISSSVLIIVLIVIIIRKNKKENETD